MKLHRNFNFPPSFSPRASIARHLFFTGFTKKILTTVITRLESNSQSTHSNLLSKRFSSRCCLKFRRGNNARNGIYSFPTEVIADPILVCLFFERRPPKKCAGLGTFGYFDETNPITDKSIQLRSPDYGSCRIYIYMRSHLICLPYPSTSPGRLVLP